MREFFKVFLPLILLICVFAFVGYIFIIQESRLRAQCERKGGVWLSHENQCVKGERIPLDE